MPEDDFRPYAATANVVAIIERARTRNLPETVTNDFLGLAQIPEVVYGRVRQALEFLDLIHEDGRPTANLQSLAKAPESEYLQVLATCIREAYRDDFQRIDPSQDNQGQIIEAFRRYQPRSQTSRMVMLFLGLCRTAGIPVLDAPRERKMQPKTNGLRRTSATSARPAPIRAAPKSYGPSGTYLDRLLTRGVPTALFEVSEDDIAALDEDDFEEVWTALGKVARARARAAHQRAPQQPNPAGQASARDDEGAAEG